MPLKHDRPGDEVTVVGRWADGLTWMAHPDEKMRRASHAMAVDGNVWVVDPVDADGLDEILAGLGRVTGVIVLTNSHGRHADRLAVRHNVSVHVPACFDADSHPLSHFYAPVEQFDDELADTGFELVWEKDGAGWKEGALYHPDRRTLVIPDALMTCLFTKADGRLEVFPLFRWAPPREELGSLTVDRVLIGHGEPVLYDAQSALDAALAAPRHGFPSAIVRSVPTFAQIAYYEIRS